MIIRYLFLLPTTLLFILFFHSTPSHTPDVSSTCKMSYYATCHATESHGLHALKGCTRVPNISSWNWRVFTGANVHAADACEVVSDFNLTHPKNIFRGLDFFNRISSEHILICEGHRTTLCQKDSLCETAHKAGMNGVFSAECYNIPAQKKQLHDALNIDAESKWVLKSTSPGVHHGNGVFFYSSLDLRLALDQRYSKSKMVVQKYIEPKIWPQLLRKPEIRMYVLITSMQPLRLYAGGTLVVHAPALYSEGCGADQLKCKCSFSAHTSGADLHCDHNVLSDSQRKLLWEDWVRIERVPERQASQIQKSLKNAVTSAYLAAQATASLHPWVSAIKKKNATCYSYHRVDAAIDKNLRVKIVEINEYPFLNEPVPKLRKCKSLTSLRCGQCLV